MTIVTSDTIKALAAALLSVQGALDGVGKTSENPGYKRNGQAIRYANLEAVIDTAKPELQRAGVVFVQSGGAIVENVMAMTTRLIHAESGEWIEGTMDIMLGKPDPQGVGSALTYAQRYHLMAMLGLPPIDDDGEAAIDRENKRPAQVAPPAPAMPPPAAMGTLPIDKLTGMKNTAQRALWGRLQVANRVVTSLAEFNALWAHPASQAAYDNFPKDWQDMMDDEKRDKEAELRERAPANDPTAALDRQFPGDIPLTHAQKIAATP